MSSSSRIALLSAIVLTACSRTIASSAVPPLAGSPSIPADFRLSLWRGPCWGDCPVYRVQVDRSGHVDWEGMGYVATPGSTSWTIPPSSVAKLLAKCDELGFFDLKLHCDLIVYDAPQVGVELTRGGSTKCQSSVMPFTCDSAKHDDPEVHGKFAAFADALDEILETSSRIRWTSDEPFRAR